MANAYQIRPLIELSVDKLVSFISKITSMEEAFLTRYFLTGRSRRTPMSNQWHRLTEHANLALAINHPSVKTGFTAEGKAEEETLD